MGKKKSSTSQTTTSAPPSWAVPIIQGGSQAVMDNYTANQGNLQSLANGLTGSILPGIQQQIGDTKQQLQPGFNYLNSTLSSNFLNNGQSQAKALADFAGQQAGNQINATFGKYGRTGSTDHAIDLARGVTQAELAPMLQNLQYNEGIQNQAAGLLPGMTSAQYAGYTPLLAGTQLAGQLPYYGSQSLGTIGNLLGNYGTSTSKGSQPGGWGSDLIGAAASALPFILSDRRLKKDIKKVGEAKDGLGIYEFVYKFDPTNTVNRGVMADEVKELRPEAYVPNYRGEFAGVNYAALGDLS